MLLLDLRIKYKNIATTNRDFIIISFHHYKYITKFIDKCKSMKNDKIPYHLDEHGIAYQTKKPMGLKLSPLDTSFFAAVQVLAFKVGENDKK